MFAKIIFFQGLNAQFLDARNETFGALRRIRGIWVFQLIFVWMVHEKDDFTLLCTFGFACWV